MSSKNLKKFTWMHFTFWRRNLSHELRFYSNAQRELSSMSPGLFYFASSGKYAFDDEKTRFTLGIGRREEKTKNRRVDECHKTFHWHRQKFLFLRFSHRHSTNEYCQQEKIFRFSFFFLPFGPIRNDDHGWIEQIFAIFLFLFLLTHTVAHTHTHTHRHIHSYTTTHTYIFCICAVVDATTLTTHNHKYYYTKWREKVRNSFLIFVFRMSRTLVTAVISFRVASASVADFSYLMRKENESGERHIPFLRISIVRDLKRNQPSGRVI